MFTRCLVLLRRLSDDRVFSLLDPVVDRFCLSILPQIRHKINYLVLESSSAERILTIDYPNIYGLSLYNINEEIAQRWFIDSSPLFDIFNKKIRSLCIRIVDKGSRSTDGNLVACVFTNILNVFNNLRYLNCNTFERRRLRRLSFDEKSFTFVCSTLTELRINVVYLNDCLQMLTGGLNQLRTFYVNIECVFSKGMIKDNKPVPHLKCFSLTCRSEMYTHKYSIVPLIRRMLNLEELSLYIVVGQCTFLDGNALKNDFINHLPRLNKFAFSIRSVLLGPDPAYFVSNEDIQQTLKDLGDVPVRSYVDYFPSEKTGQCHFYSDPYTLTYCDRITNSFQGRLFNCVREVSLFDDRPFEHEFFVRIAHAFPFLEQLTVSNETPQEQKLNSNNREFPIIQYPRLIELDFTNVHDDYIEQFLLDTKTCLPQNMTLYISYDSLKRVTRNFRRATMRVNCCQISNVLTYDKFPTSKRLTKYFLNAYISTQRYSAEI
ncbi:unnamed protein product [Adineta ricciae]|uniref:Uncharacterized protein n=1 Tax=Adineta ricciae TaxID=249248 RepID=A0A814Z6U5_ADIRI|nr:unnamed protein product [Adineta ricciae]